MHHTTSSDEEFSAWVRTSYPRMVRTCALMLGDQWEAEDLVQTVLGRIYLRWHALDRVRADGALDAYVRTALTRQATSWWRMPWRKSCPSNEIPQASSAEDVASAVASSNMMMRHLNELSKQQRAAIVLRYYEDLPEDAIASAMGCSVGTVKSHLSRGLARLRTLLPSPAQEVMS